MSANVKPTSAVVIMVKSSVKTVQSHNVNVLHVHVFADSRNIATRT